MAGPALTYDRMGSARETGRDLFLLRSAELPVQSVRPERLDVLYSLRPSKAIPRNVQSVITDYARNSLVALEETSPPRLNNPGHGVGVNGS